MAKMEKLTRKDIIAFTQNNYYKNYYTVNKHLLKAIGIEAAFFLDVLLKRQQLVQSAYAYDWFYYTGDKILEDVNISKKVQKRLFDKLEQFELIKTKMNGLPACRYIKINYAKLMELIPEKDVVAERQIQVDEEDVYDYDRSNILDFNKSYY